MIILGIETSCDETAASIVEGLDNHVKVLSNIVSSQIELHQKYGGVVPEIAAREHVLNIIPVINEALLKANLKPEQLDAIAVTAGPGLITSLMIGVETAKTLAYAWNLPIVAINHIAGHISANFIDQEQPLFPKLILTVSGGHTNLVLMEDYTKFTTLAETRDDAAGEAFDKAAKIMEIGYPGGPIVSKYAEEACVKTTHELSLPKLPRPMLHSPEPCFSFSGLKTALLYQIQKDANWKNRIPEYCYEFQQAIIDVLIKKTIKTAQKYQVKQVMLSGGVSANKQLREQLAQAVKKSLPQATFSMPDLKYTTDNAAMIASAGYFMARENKFTNWQDLRTNPGLTL